LKNNYQDNKNNKNGAIMTIIHTPKLRIDNMILIGATGRNSGKTTLALKIIDKFKSKIPIIAIKLITVQNKSDTCARGGHGCGICHGLHGCFDIKEEVGTGTKDTMLLKKAGAQKVYLVRALKEHTLEALSEVLKQIPANALILCESNSARLVLEPACFVMIKGGTSESIKPTAKAVIEYTDVLLPQEEHLFVDFVENKLQDIISIKEASFAASI